MTRTLVSQARCATSAWRCSPSRCSWARSSSCGRRITGRILGKLAPFFTALANLGGLSHKDIEEVVFEGPGKFMRTVIGGERIALDSAMDMLSIGYVHPLMVTVFCIWGVGRAAGADRRRDRPRHDGIAARPARGALAADPAPTCSSTSSPSRCCA